MPNQVSSLIARYMSGVLVILALASCKTQNLFTTDKAAPPQQDDSSFYKTTLNYEYTIRKDDKVNISVWDNDDVSVGSAYGIYNSNEVYGKWLMVDARGKINVPMIGDLRVLGLTVPQTEDTLRSLYAQWIKRPIVDVKVLNKEVVVMGEMKAPGKFVIEKDNNSLMEILAKAGDFDFYANKKKIQVIRVENNQVKQIVVDLTRTDNYFARNIRIIPGDIVYVPAKKGKDFDKRISAAIAVASVITASVVIYKTFF
jgi:polysaccharide biosynthesis/export protein